MQFLFINKYKVIIKLKYINLILAALLNNWKLTANRILIVQYFLGMLPKGFAYIYTFWQCNIYVQQC